MTRTICTHLCVSAALLFGRPAFAQALPPPDAYDAVVKSHALYNFAKERLEKCDDRNEGLHEENAALRDLAKNPRVVTEEVTRTPWYVWVAGGAAIVAAFAGGLALNSGSDRITISAPKGQLGPSGVQ